MEKSSRSLTSLQQSIEQQILAMITEQGLKKGDRLPSHEELVERLGVSRATVRESLTRLEQRGVIKKVHGIGTFVADDLKSVHSSAEINLSLTEMILSQGMQPGTKWIDVRVVDLQPEMQFCFDDPKDQALLVRRVKTADGLPFAYSISYIDLSIPNLETRPEAYFDSIYQYLHDRCGEFVSDTDTEIEAGIANEEISERLEVPVGSPVLVMRQCHLNKTGKILIVSTEYFVQARLKLKVRRHRPGID
jgi:GntR family transcriptional regulator